MCQCPFEQCDHNLNGHPCKVAGSRDVTRLDMGDDKVLMFCEACYREHRGVMVTLASPKPTPFGRERAEELWAARGLQWDMEEKLTPGENAYVNQVWMTLPGTSTWMDAFFRIRDGKVG